jgi:hypothetical protein
MNIYETLTTPGIARSDRASAAKTQGQSLAGSWRGCLDDTSVLLLFLSVCLAQLVPLRQVVLARLLKRSLTSPEGVYLACVELLRQ